MSAIKVTLTKLIDGIEVKGLSDGEFFMKDGDTLTISIDMDMMKDTPVMSIRAGPAESADHDPLIKVDPFSVPVKSDVPVIEGKDALTW